MASTLAFPSSSNRHSVANMSIVSLHATALEVCDFVYGEGDVPAPLDAIDRFYETSANSRSHDVSSLTRLVCSYENPLLTATSRSVIADIYRLSRQFSKVDVPKPLAMFYTLFRLKPPRSTGGQSIHDPLFQALRVWTEIGDMSESESFDGHRKTVVEHTLNILFLPGLHRDSATTSQQHSSSSAISLSTTPPHPSAPSLPLPMTSFSVPSPFHFRLHIITRLSFNEQGRITHHRDFWDVKDVLGLVPGLGLAQWISGRVTAQGLGMISRFLTGQTVSTPLTRSRSHSFFHSYPDSVDHTRPQSYASSEWGDGDLEGARTTPVIPHRGYGKNSLGLDGLE